MNIDCLKKSALIMETYTSDSSSDAESHVVDYRNSNLTLSKAESEFFNLYKTDKMYDEIETIMLFNNQLSGLPLALMKFNNLHTLDISNNCLKTISMEVILHCPLKTLIAKNNQLTNASLPKSLQSSACQLRELNLSGNNLTHFPKQVLELNSSLKYLYLNGNCIQTISKEIGKLRK